MNLRLQFGYGMMEHSRALLAKWQGGAVVLSPRDLTSDQLIRLGADVRAISNSSCLVDPQFYLPHADHFRLCSHSFWPANYDSGVFWTGPQLRELLTNLFAVNREVGATELVLPGILATSVNDDWLEIQRSIIEEAKSIDSTHRLIATVAVGSDSVRSVDQIGDLLEAAEHWACDGFYLVCEHPNGQYLVDEPNWLANVLDLAAGLKLLRKPVLLGYSNHQMLAAAVAKVDALASGTWMNVRSFPPEKFQASYEDEIRQRATWYYCPQALSEYKIPFLDIAHRQGVLNRMAPPPALDGGYVRQLFAGDQPSIVGLAEQSAFRHYLYALHEQVRTAVKPTYDETLTALRTQLDEAEQLLAELRRAGVTGQMRDFTEMIEVNRSALTVFDSSRGAMMRRVWTAL